MKVSVVIPAYNEAAGISPVVQAILANTYSAIELLVVDDGSSDETYTRLLEIEDSRLRILRNTSRQGPAASLNRGIEAASGEIIFFTDADCVVAPDWIEQGMRSLEDPNVAGVEGDIFYPVKPTSIRFKVPCNPFYHSFSRCISRSGRDFATGNIAYRRDVLRAIGGFDFRRYGLGREDTELGWRVLEHGPILHNSKMKVEHRYEEWTWKALFLNAARYEKDVLFFRDHGFFFFRTGRILHPKLLFFPVLFWKYRRMPLRDFRFVPALLAYLVLARLFIWRGAFRYRTFVI